VAADVVGNPTFEAQGDPAAAGAVVVVIALVILLQVRAAASERARDGRNAAILKLQVLQARRVSEEITPQALREVELQVRHSLGPGWGPARTQRTPNRLWPGWGGSLFRCWRQRQLGWSLVAKLVSTKCLVLLSIFSPSSSSPSAQTLLTLFHCRKPDPFVGALGADRTAGTGRSGRQEALVVHGRGD
jgi:hypothetical protein